uniref:Septin-type G domain-containing protein n=1 Tax=Sander lucioperca TaxID=283035 RepID=A0A8D0A075_SANLU
MYLLFYRNTSSKFNNIPKYLIQSGSPTLYQLIPKKEKIGTLTRMTLGEKDPNKINKTILLVGETGTGKSTLINSLVNYAMGVEWEDDVWFQIIVEDEKRSQGESQTSDVIVYQIFGFEDKTLPYSLTIIDTPGYGDTTGIEHDAIVSQQFFDLFHSVDGVHEVDAVGLVMKGSENRLNDRLRYIFDSVMSLFGKDIEKNIVTLITHSNGVTPENVLKALKAAKFRCAKDEKNQPVHFLFDNCQNELRTENTMYLKNADEISMKGMSQFTDFLNIPLHQNLKTTVEVLKARIGLTDGIKNLQERIQSIDLKQEEIKQTQEALNIHKEEMKNNEKFTEEVDEPYKVKQKVSRERRWWALGLNHGGAVCCTVCKENCHYPCTLAWYPEHCWIMKDGRCTVCTGKCPASDHVKEKQCTDCEGKCSDESSHVKKHWIYVTKTRKVQKTEQDLSLLETLEKNMEELQKDKDRLLEESFQHVVQLEQIALKVDAVSTQVDLDFLIEKMKEKGDMEKKKKLEEMKRLMDKDKGIKAALRYKFGKLREAVGI